MYQNKHKKTEGHKHLTKQKQSKENNQNKTNKSK